MIKMSENVWFFLKMSESCQIYFQTCEKEILSENTQLKIQIFHLIGENAYTWFYLYTWFISSVHLMKSSEEIYKSSVSKWYKSSVEKHEISHLILKSSVHLT